ncbi:MAG: molecular chaperone DnaJ [Lachnospiraceae bacterium]|nr:molecular chaperone DnaJ [Lachnospiraceae bacterium]
MKQQNNAVLNTEDASEFENWRFQQTVELERTRRKIEDEKKTLETARRDLERQKKEFEYTRSNEMDHIRREQHLFEMKWKMLEDELQRFAADKQRFEKQKAFYSRVNEYEAAGKKATSAVLKGDLFFTGVSTEGSLKKRYKDLIKIYHPDNLNGDTKTIQEINREYDALRKKFDGRRR